jgi:hypothetical protein
VEDRISLRCENTGRTRAPQYEQKFQRSSISLWHSAHVMDLTSNKQVCYSGPALIIRQKRGCREFIAGVRAVRVPT